MVDCENPLEAEPKKGAHSNGNCENRPNTLHRMRLTNRGQQAKWRKKCVLGALIIVCCAVTAGCSVALTKLLSGPCPTTTVHSCPSGWVGYEGKCYYFSDAEATWDFSRRNCSAYGASLVEIENQKEMKFIMHHKRPTDYWIGLKRKEGQPWEWEDGSVFSGWFDIGADGPCAYLNDEKASSTWCHTERNWICSKSTL